MEFIAKIKIEDLVFGLANSNEFCKSVAKHMRLNGCTLEQWQKIAPIACLDLAMELAKNDRETAEKLYLKYTK